MMQLYSPRFELVPAPLPPGVAAAITSLLQAVDLDFDPRSSLWVLGWHQQRLLACAGLDHNVIKCVAVHPAFQASQIALTLMYQVMVTAHDKGIDHLFLYTKPANSALFKRCGFYPIVTFADCITLLENTPVGVTRYCHSLAKHKRAGRCGAIVMNANPFTKGHLYLVEQALSMVDWLYIWLVSEEASLFTSATRLQLVQAGVKHLAKVIVLPGSPYLISQVTFPGYFLKHPAQIAQSYMAIDLLIFRQYIAPALAIGYRFVGSEPYSAVTRAYNQAMHYWLQNSAVAKTPPLTVIEIARVCQANTVISASRVRQLLLQKNYAAVQSLVPPTTWAYLQQHYIPHNP